MVQPPLTELRYEPLPEVAAALRQSLSQIIARWRAEVRRLLPDADELTRRQLENSLPELLKQMADALEACDSNPTDRLIAASPAHGTTRFHQHFDLNELLLEYAIARRIILEELIEVLRRQPTLAETIAVNEAIDVAARQAAVAYANYQADSHRIEANAMAKYLAFLSHDLRGNLNGAVLMIELLRREMASDGKYATALEDLDSMRRSMLETVATTDRFLSAEKLRRGHVPVKVETIGIRSLLEHVSRGFVYQTKEEGQLIRVEADPSLVVDSDQELLAMILHNLVSNAIKYGEGKPISLRGEPATADSPMACKLSVIDRGPGIAPEKLPTIFTPFTRGETYGKRGMGLGLFIVREAADLLQARLSVDSQPGSGSTFHVELPRNPPRRNEDLSSTDGEDS